MNSFVVFLQIQQGYLLTVQASSYHIHEIPVGNVKFSLFYETQGVLFPSEMNRNKKDVCEVQEREMEEGTSGRNMQTAFMKITFEWLFSVTSSSKTNAQQGMSLFRQYSLATVRSVQHVTSLPVGTHPCTCLHGRVLLPSFQ